MFDEIGVESSLKNAESPVMLFALDVMLHVLVDEKLMMVAPNIVVGGVAIVVVLHSIAVTLFESWEKTRTILVCALTTNQNPYSSRSPNDQPKYPQSAQRYSSY